MNQGDIFRVSLDPAVGHEQSGYRPVLVISNDAFNTSINAAVILPITSGGDFSVRRGFAVELSGTHTTGRIRCEQPRLADLRGRGAKFVERVPSDVLNRALAKVATIFE